MIRSGSLTRSYRTTEGDPGILPIGRVMTENHATTLLRDLQRLEMPSWVRDIRVSDAEDEYGDAVLQVTLLVDDTTNLGERREELRHLRSQVRAQVLETCPDRWAYVQFRSLAEQSELDHRPVHA